MGNFASMGIGAFSKRLLHLKMLFSLRNIVNQFQICFSCQESKFLPKGLVPFYQKIISITSAFFNIFCLKLLKNLKNLGKNTF